MNLKQIFSKKSSFLSPKYESKVLNQNVYNKFLIRSKVFGSSELGIIDNNLSMFNVSSSDLELNGDFLQKGKPLNLKTSFFSHNSVRSVSFESFDFNNKVENFSFIGSLYCTLNSINSHYTGSLIILRPIRGGFTCYSSGVVGFLPRRQSILLFSSLFETMLNSNNLLPGLTFLLNKKNSSGNLMSIRFPHSWGKTVAYSMFFNQRFIPFASQQSSTKLSFVFVSKRMKKNTFYEN